MPNSEIPFDDHHLALPEGFQIEEYRLIRVLGQGGFGITYLAADAYLGKEVAIKEMMPDGIATRAHGTTVVPETQAQSDNFEWALQRFYDEAQSLAKLDHPNIVRIFRLFRAHGTAYMVMEFIRGQSFEKWLQFLQGPPEEAVLRSALDSLLDGLEYVHAQSLLHRDIKPENIYIRDDGRPVLLDFGCARASLEKTALMTSVVSHGYSPFEQYQTQSRQGPFTDLYSLAGVMARAITGVKPPSALDRYADPHLMVALSERARGRYSEALLGALDWALAVLPDQRPQTVAEFRERLHKESSEPAPPVELAKQFAPDSELRALAAASAERRSQPPGASRAKPGHRLLLTCVVALGVVGGGFLAYRTLGHRVEGKPLLATSSEHHGGLSDQQYADCRRSIEKARTARTGIGGDLPAETVDAMVAEVLAKAGDWREAHEVARTIARNPLEWKALHSIALAQCAEGRYAEAIATAKEIPNPLQKDWSVGAIVRSQLESGSTEHLAEAASLGVSPEGKSLLMAIAANAQALAGNKQGALKTLVTARDRAVVCPKGHARERVLLTIACAFCRAGDLTLAKQVAAMIPFDVHEDPVTDVAITQAETGDVDGAVATALTLPSTRAQGTALIGIARVQAASGKVPQAYETAKRAPISDQRSFALARVCCLTGDVIGAKAAFEALKRDTHNSKDRKKLYMDALPKVAALITRVEGAAAAEKWLDTSALPMAIGWLGIASAWLATDPVQPLAPKADLNTINAFAASMMQ